MKKETVPNAPPLYPDLPDSDQFRLSEVTRTKRELEKESDRYLKTRRRYKVAHKVFMYTNTGLSIVSTATGAATVTTLATGIGIPIALPIGVASIVSGLLSAASSLGQKITLKKLQKHERLSAVAYTKLGSVNGIVSKALENERLEHGEYQLILKEMEDYKKKKSEIRGKSRVSVGEVVKKELLERGRREGMEEATQLLKKQAQTT